MKSLNKLAFIAILGFCMGCNDDGYTLNTCVEPLKIEGEVSISEMNLTFARDLDDYPGEIQVKVSGELIILEPSSIGLRWSYFSNLRDLEQIVFTEGEFKGIYSVLVTTPLAKGLEYIINLNNEVEVTKILNIQLLEENCTDLILY